MMVGFTWLLWALLDDNASLEMLLLGTFWLYPRHCTLYGGRWAPNGGRWVLWWLGMPWDTFQQILGLGCCIDELWHCRYNLMCHWEGKKPIAWTLHPLRMLGFWWMSLHLLGWYTLWRDDGAFLMHDVEFSPWMLHTWRVTSCLDWCYLALSLPMHVGDE